MAEQGDERRSGDEWRSEDERRFGEFVVVRRHEHVAELALDRPKAMNAVSTDMARSLAGACAALAADPGVRVVVLTSTHERAFCVGADLKERNSFTDADLMRQRPWRGPRTPASWSCRCRPSPPCTASRSAAGSSWRSPAT